MTLTERIELIRDDYLSRFIEIMNEHESTISEAALLNSAGVIVREGEYDLPMRLDIVVNESDRAAKTLQVDTQQMLDFDPIDVHWQGGLTVRIGPFQWNWLPISLIGQGIGPRPLIAWFERWFHEQAAFTSNELLGTVHFMSDPRVSAGRIDADIDMGSAPVGAIEDLLDAAVQCGASRVEIGENAT